jgi:hypothetical protein
MGALATEESLPGSAGAVRPAHDAALRHRFGTSRAIAIEEPRSWLVEAMARRLRAMLSPTRSAACL